MKTAPITGITLSLAICFIGALLLYAWSPLPVQADRRVFMPGSQPGSVNLKSATRCDNCHGGYNVYYSQDGKYTLIATVNSPGYTDSGLKPGSTYSYAVTAFVNCSDGTMEESGYSSTASAVPTR